MAIAATGTTRAPLDDWPAPDDPPPAEPTRRRVLPFAIVAVAVALASAAAAVVITRPDDTKHASVAAATPIDGNTIVMPSLLMFTRADAVSQLGRMGVQPNRIRETSVPREDVAPGTVLDQVPAAGIPIAGRVTLTISTAPAHMPTFVGQDINAARVTLSTLNVTLTTQDELDGNVPDGTVLAQSPAAGAPFAPAVHLTVARSPIPTNLGDLGGVGARPTPSDAETIAGTQYPNSLTWRVSECSAAPIAETYALGGNYRKLTTTAALGAETADPTDRVHFEIRVDGTVVGARNLDVHTPVPVSVDVTRHHQLELTFTPVAAASPNCSNATAVLGQAQLWSTARGR